ncbi:hypothetical protein ACMXYW_11515 [Neptuniibacter sp. QD48_55]|uniref:hypothetical protein n=1 Tax=Neptuniibacter sp. QD48_55 TaxID=3398212 RepID=UPI0039F589D5
MKALTTKKTDLPEITYMSPSEWMELDDCSRQRNTPKHAKSAVVRHLSESHNTHAVVNAAKWPDGSLSKLDGHTRAFLWASGQLAAPDQLLVVVWKVNSKEEAENYYLTFDNRSASELNNQLLFGTLRKHGVELQSSLLMQGGLYASLQHIYGVRDMGINLPTEIVGTIGAIDRKNYNKIKTVPMCSGFMAAMIATVYRDEERAFNFWDCYYDDGGKKDGRHWDGVHGLSVILAREANNGTGRDQARIRMRRALNCYEAFRNNKMLGKNVTEMRITKFVPNAQHY